MWLHEPDALHAIAIGEPGPAADWANARLALHAPALFSAFPTEPTYADAVMAAAPPTLTPALVAALQAGRPNEELASAVAALGTYGALPEDPGPLVDALNAAQGDGRPADLWIALALLKLDALTPAALAPAARATSPDTEWLLPSLVLEVGARIDQLDDAARGVADGLAPRLRRNPALLGAVLTALGVPSNLAPEQLRTLQDAAEAGAALGGGEVPAFRASRGSRKRRTQSLMATLLDGIHHPAAALLRALYRKDGWNNLGYGPIAVAAWLHTYQASDDPVHDVLWRAGGGDLTRLSAARRLAAGHGASVQASLEKGLGIPPAVVGLACLDEVPDLAHVLVGLFLEAGRADLRIEHLAVVAVAHRPELVLPLLAEPENRRLGLVLAEWTPTEAVLGELLQLPLPADATDRALLARALASMGDSAVLGPLAQLTEEDAPGMAWSRNLAHAILRIP